MWLARQMLAHLCGREALPSYNSLPHTHCLVQMSVLTPLCCCLCCVPQMVGRRRALPWTVHAKIWRPHLSTHL